MCQPALTFCYRGIEHKSRVQCTLLHKQGINQALNVDLHRINNVMDIFIWQWQILCFWNAANCSMNVNICMVAPVDWKTWMITMWYNKIFRVKFVKIGEFEIIDWFHHKFSLNEGCLLLGIQYWIFWRKVSVEVKVEEFCFWMEPITFYRH